MPFRKFPAKLQKAPSVTYSSHSSCPIFNDSFIEKVKNSVRKSIVLHYVLLSQGFPYVVRHLVDGSNLKLK